MSQEINVPIPSSRPLTNQDGTPTREFRELLNPAAIVGNQLSEFSGDSDDITEGNDNLFLTPADQTKLDGIEAGAEVNVQSDWDENNSSDDSFIQNRPVNIITADGSQAMTAPFELAESTVANLPTGTTSEIIYCTNGDAGSPCLAVYNGTNWLRVVLGAAVSEV